MINMKRLLFVILPFILLSCGDELKTRRVSSTSNPNSNGLSIETCEAVYKPVCGQPPMPVCAPGFFCATVMPAPKTYDNECQMTKSGATLISEGACAFN
tara:strand:- start:542 stop:838 length:297 start_codon:yes stop_codon:yes gene_type:complete